MRYELANNIKKLRLEKRMTQTQLANKLGIGTSIISAYENQERLPSINVLIKLSYEFNVTIEYLLGMSKNTKLRIIRLLTDSLIKSEIVEPADDSKEYTRKMLDKYAGAWSGNESADELMAAIRENSSVREPMQF